MPMIDTSSWKKYPITELFDLSLPSGDLQVKKVEDGDIPLITPSNYNNGLLQRISADSESTKYKAKLLTVDMFGNAYYQEEDFFVTAHGHVNVLIPKFEINLYIGFFMASAIKAMFMHKYSFSEMCTQKVLKKETISLPVNPAGEPDWNYMETYMKNTMKDAEDILKNFTNFEEAQETKIDVTSFKRFNLYDDDLFIIDSGTKLDKIKMTSENPSINFVGRANANNGVTDYIDEIEGLEPYKAGYLTISLGGEYLGSCFVQSKPFYTSQNVNVLIPRHEMSDYSKRYIATMVFREGRLHYKAFIDELNRHMKTDFSIPLPVKDDESIDWEYMDSYMKKIEEECLGNLHLLQEV